jgi:hypothetical protein
MQQKPYGMQTTPVEGRKSDAGRKATIHSIGGAITNETGKVVDGPYTLTFRAKQKQRDTKVTTEPYWLVKLDANGFYIHFAENEITLS